MKRIHSSDCRDLVGCVHFSVGLQQPLTKAAMDLREIDWLTWLLKYTVIASKYQLRESELRLP